jgi:hypothetical protein
MALFFETLEHTLYYPLLDSSGNMISSESAATATAASASASASPIVAIGKSQQAVRRRKRAKLYGIVQNSNPVRGQNVAKLVVAEPKNKSASSGSGVRRSNAKGYFWAKPGEPTRLSFSMPNQPPPPLPLLPPTYCDDVLRCPVQWDVGREKWQLLGQSFVFCYAPLRQNVSDALHMTAAAAAAADHRNNTDTDTAGSGGGRKRLLVGTVSDGNRHRHTNGATTDMVEKQSGYVSPFYGTSFSFVYATLFRPVMPLTQKGAVLSALSTAVVPAEVAEEVAKIHDEALGITEETRAAAFIAQHGRAASFAIAPT